MCAGAVARASSERQSALAPSVLPTSAFAPRTRDGVALDWCCAYSSSGAWPWSATASELPAPSARRAWSLLAYLALAPGPQPRGELAARFWPDVLDSSARASLRSAVWSLRRTLGPAAERSPDRRSQPCRPGTRPGAVGGRRSRSTTLVRAGREREAVELCTGELLAGFEEEWALMRARRPPRASAGGARAACRELRGGGRRRRRRSSGAAAQSRSIRSARTPTAG